MTIREIILSSIERRKTAQNVAKVRIRPRAVVQPPTEVKGDVNGDKVVDEGDAILMLRFRAGLTTLTAAQQRIGDVNGDGTLDEGDVILILRFRAGLIPKLSKPVGSGIEGQGSGVRFGEAKAVSDRHSSLVTRHSLLLEVPLILDAGVYGGALTLTYDATAYGAAEVKGPEGVLMAIGAGSPGAMRLHVARARAEEPAVLWVILKAEGSPSIRPYGATRDERLTVAPSSSQRLRIEGREADDREFILRLTGQVFGVDGLSLGVVEDTWNRPVTSSLSVAYPNPFNPVTTIRYDLAEEGEVRLTVYNLSGQVVRRLVSGWQAAGRYSVVWEGRDDAGRAVASGVYLGRLEAGAFQQTQKMLLLK